MGVDRLVKIDNHAGEFLLVAAFQVKLGFLVAAGMPGLTAIHLEEAISGLPESVVPAYRKKRSYISSLLAKNEVESSQAHNRKLFRRVRHGHYILNPEAQVKRGEAWVGVTELLNLKLLERIVPQGERWIVELLQGRLSSGDAFAISMGWTGESSARRTAGRPRSSARAGRPVQEPLPLLPAPPLTVTSRSYAAEH